MSDHIDAMQAEYARLATEARHAPITRGPEIIGDWKSELEVKQMFPESTNKKTGETKRIRVVKREIILTKEGRNEIRFSVTHITNKKTGFRSTTISDKRAEGTGNLGTRGPWFTRKELPIPNRAKSLTPTSWVSEVAPRFISADRAWSLLAEAGYDFGRREI